MTINERIKSHPKKKPDYLRLILQNGLEQRGV